MPRQDVPYGGAICRLKERIAEIWDKLDQKLHSINGVEGDGAGNLNIVSGDAAITVSESPTGHFIEIGLDHGNLPSAAVSSVNGQTGAVRLDAADIPSDGNSNVQSDIAANKAAINDCFDSITSEQVARQNADATLQTNINAVSASIPDMSVTPDIYKGVKRDAQGRAFAADPESGATDKTLVTANWVSQTGDDAPNNVAHRNGNETWLGLKTIDEISLSYLRATTVNPNNKTIILYDLGGTAENTFNFQVCIECIGRGHWRQLYLQIYNDHTNISAQNVIANDNDGLKVIRRVSDNHTYIGVRTIQNDFPDVQIKYCQYRGTLPKFTKTIVDITDSQDYTVEDIPMS